MIFNKDSKNERSTEKEYDAIPNQGLKYGLYSFYDVCSQTFGNPFVCQNDEVAMREKRAFCQLPHSQLHNRVDINFLILNKKDNITDNFTCHRCKHTKAI